MRAREQSTTYMCMQRMSVVRSARDSSTWVPSHPVFLLAASPASTTMMHTPHTSPRSSDTLGDARTLHLHHTILHNTYSQMSGAQMPQARVSPCSSMRKHFTASERGIANTMKTEEERECVIVALVMLLTIEDALCFNRELR